MYVKYEIQTPLQKLGKKEFVRKDIIFSYSKRCYENCKLVQGIEKPTGPPWRNACVEYRSIVFANI